MHIVNRALGVTFLPLLLIGLSGCGKSKDDMYGQMIGCAGFSSNVMLVIGHGELFDQVNAILQQDGVTPVGSVGFAMEASKYMTSMEPAKAQRLMQDGTKQFNDLAAKNDIAGIAAYLKDCDSTYAELAK